MPSLVLLTETPDRHICPLGKATLMVGSATTVSAMITHSSLPMVVKASLEAAVLLTRRDAAGPMKVKFPTAVETQPVIFASVKLTADGHCNLEAMPNGT